MADAKKYLSFSNLETGQPVIAFCSVCGMKFEQAPDPEKRTDELILKVRADFEAHQCNGTF